MTDNAKPIAAEQLTNCEPWQMPVLEATGNLVFAAGKGRDRSKESRGGNLSVEPLTASKIEALRQQAYQEGLEQGKQEGYQAGMQKAKAEIEDTMGRLNRILGQLMHPLAEQEAEVEQALVRLTKAVAQSVVQHQVDVDADRLLNVINQALSQLPDASQHIRIIVHPNDAELIGRMPHSQSQDWQIIADASLVSGGCIVKTEHSYVDFTLEQQFQLTVDQMVRQQFQGTDSAILDEDPSVRGDGL